MIRPDFRCMGLDFHDDGDGTVHVTTTFRDGAYLSKDNTRALVEWLNTWLNNGNQAEG